MKNMILIICFFFLLISGVPSTNPNTNSAGYDGEITECVEDGI